MGNIMKLLPYSSHFHVKCPISCIFPLVLSVITDRSLAEEHQEHLPYYLEAEGYEGILKILDKVGEYLAKKLEEKLHQKIENNFLFSALNSSF